MTTETFTVRRFNSETGAVMYDITTGEKAARSLVFWCAYDNVGMSKQDSRRAANAATIGDPYSVGNYVFTIERAAL